MAERRAGDRRVLFLCTQNSTRGQEDEMRERFRQVRDEIELKIKDWPEHPGDESRKLKWQRECDVSRL